MNAQQSPRYRMPPRVIWVMIAIALAGAAIWGFLEGSSERAMEAERERPVVAPLRVSTVAGEPTVTLSADELTRSGIELADLEETEFAEQIAAYATILDLGPLVELSNSYTGARVELETARARLDVSRTAAERARRLHEDQQNVSLAELQAAEAAFRIDRASVAAAEVTAENLGSSAQQQWGAVLGRALIDRAPAIVRLLQTQDVLLQVTLPSGMFLAVPPATAAVRADAVSSTIAYLSRAPRTDARIQGVSFLYTAPADGVLLPGMNVVVMLATGETVRGALVPASAIVWTQGRPWAYFRNGEGVFVRRELPIDRPVSGGGYFVAGLADGTEVVGQGAQLLLSEEFRSQIQVGDE